MIVTLTQRVSAGIGDGGERREMVFRGGCQMVLDLGDLNKADYVIVEEHQELSALPKRPAYVQR